MEPTQPERSPGSEDAMQRNISLKKNMTEFLDFRLNCSEGKTERKESGIKELSNWQESKPRSQFWHSFKMNHLKFCFCWVSISYATWNRKNAPNSKRIIKRDNRGLKWNTLSVNSLFVRVLIITVLFSEQYSSVIFYDKY